MLLKCRHLHQKPYFIRQAEKFFQNLWCPQHPSAFNLSLDSLWLYLFWIKSKVFAIATAYPSEVTFYFFPSSLPHWLLSGPWTQKNILLFLPLELLLTHRVKSPNAGLYSEGVSSEKLCLTPLLTWILSSQYLLLSDVKLSEIICLCVYGLFPSLEYKFHKGSNPNMFTGISTTTGREFILSRNRGF